MIRVNLLATDKKWAARVLALPPMEYAKEVMRQWDTDEESDVFKAGCLLLLSARARVHLNDLCKTSGYSQEFVQRCAANFRKNLIWRGEKVYACWDESLELLLDAMVGAGLLVKSYQEG